MQYRENSVPVLLCMPSLCISWDENSASEDNNFSFGDVWRGASTSHSNQPGSAQHDGRACPTGVMTLSRGVETQQVLVFMRFFEVFKLTFICDRHRICSFTVKGRNKGCQCIMIPCWGRVRGAWGSAWWASQRPERRRNPSPASSPSSCPCSTSSGRRLSCTADLYQKQNYKDRNRCCVSSIVEPYWFIAVPDLKRKRIQNRNRLQTICRTIFQQTK